MAPHAAGMGAGPAVPALHLNNLISVAEQRATHVFW